MGAGEQETMRALTTLVVVMSVVAFCHASDPQCSSYSTFCMNGQSCCRGYGGLKCQMTNSCSNIGWTPANLGKCVSNYGHYEICSESSSAHRRRATPTPSNCGSGFLPRNPPSGGAQCSNGCWCGECCMNNKCKSRDECLDDLKHIGIDVGIGVACCCLLCCVGAGVMLYMQNRNKNKFDQNMKAPLIESPDNHYVAAGSSNIASEPPPPSGPPRGNDGHYAAQPGSGGDWQTVTDPQGQAYEYNTKTMETRWL